MHLAGSKQENVVEAAKAARRQWRFFGIDVLGIA
jgi:hypothetical protein